MPYAYSEILKARASFKTTFARKSENAVVHTTTITINVIKSESFPGKVGLLRISLFEM